LFSTGKVYQTQQGGKQGLVILRWSSVLLSRSFFHTLLGKTLNLHAIRIAFATDLLPLCGCSSLWSERQHATPPD